MPDIVGVCNECGTPDELVPSPEDEKVFVCRPCAEKIGQELAAGIIDEIINGEGVTLAIKK